MVEVSIGELLLAFVAAMGIPSAIMGLIVWRFKGHIEAREEAQAEKAKAQQDLFLLIVQSTRASIALGEATAHAHAARPHERRHGDGARLRHRHQAQAEGFSRAARASTPCSMSEGRE